MLEGSAKFLGLSLAVIVLARASVAAPTTGTYHLSPPEIYKVSESSRFLASGDLNGDKRRDLVLLNNQKSLLEILLQKPDGKGFDRQERIVERVAFSLSVADLNGDGRDDILIGAQPSAVLYQDKQGRLAQPEDIRVSGTFAETGDINGDKRTDIVIFDKDRFSLILQTDDGRLGNPREYPNAVTTDQPPEILDLNGDGRLDLLYADAQQKNTVAVRYQQAPGEFGPEQKLDVGFFKSLSPLRAEGKGVLKLAMVEQRTNSLKLMEAGEPTSGGEAYALSQPRLLAFPENARPAGLTVVAADLDGGGFDHIALFSRDLAEAAFYGWNRGQDFSRQTRPVLIDIAAAAVPPKTPRPPIYVLSKKEQAIGVMRPDERGTYSFPQPLNLPGAPLAAASADLDGDAKPELLYVVKNTTGVLEVHRWKDAPASATAAATTAVAQEATTATRLRESLVVSMGQSTGADEPTAMQALDVNGDGRLDLALFFEYRPMEIFLQGEKGNWRRLFVGEGVVKGLFSEARPERFWVDDIDGDGKPEILIARESFARAVRIAPGGETTVVEQFNGRSADSQISAVATADLDGDGRKEILLVDRASNVLTVYARGEGRSFRLAANVDVPGLQVYRVYVARLNNDKADDLIVVSDRALGVLFGGGRQSRMATRWRRQAEEEDAYYAMVETGDVDNDGQDEILALENKNHVLELYRLGPKDEPERLYHFKVFDDLRGSMYRGPVQEMPAEPRELWVGDLNADGRNDLAAVAHDRLLIYYQKGPEK
jgi:hypothetical protein